MMKYLTLVFFTILTLNFVGCMQVVEEDRERKNGKIFDNEITQKIEKIVYDPQSSAPSLTGKVVGVDDGETITVLEQGAGRRRIRLFGIDAPSIKRDSGRKSLKQLSDLILGETVTVEITKTDKDGLILGKVRLEGKDVNYVQLLFGDARHDRKDRNEQNPKDRQDYAEAEMKARQAKRGLWAPLAKQKPRRN